MKKKEGDATIKEYRECAICGKQITSDSHVIKTKRKTTVYVCYDCVKP